MVEDIRETIRLGLIGGGMQQRDAFDLVGRCIREGHLIEYASLAANLMFAALAGVEDEPIPGEAIAPTTEMTTPLDF